MNRRGAEGTEFGQILGFLLALRPCGGTWAITAEAERCLTQALNLGVRLVAADEAQVGAAYAWTLKLQRTATCNSFCLALAESLGCELWTANQRLRDTIDRPWVRLARDPS